MHKKSLNLLSSANHLAEGKILIHPTEGIWGIGCDALNKKSFLRIYDLKKRPKNKSFILLIDSFHAVSKYINQLSVEELNFIDTVWPGPTTLLIDYNEKLPEHLQNVSGCGLWLLSTRGTLYDPLPAPRPPLFWGSQISQPLKKV